MRRLALAMAWLGFGAAAALADAAPAPVAPAEAMAVAPLPPMAAALRTLQMVQDRIAAGNAVALDAQRALLDRMASLADAATDPAVAALALLNGADPARFSMLRRAAEDDPLLAGAFAYAEGRLPQAAAALAAVDVTRLAPAARAQLQLTRGVLIAARDPAAAAAAFAEARLLAPGTLIEESALRRETTLRGDDAGRMAGLAASYVRRFGQSPFASAFIAHFAFAVAAAPPDVQSYMANALDGVLAPARAADRRTFFTILARETLVEGHHALARIAGERAADSAGAGDRMLSARLYRAALAIAEADPGDAAQELRSLMRAPLEPRDREILKAAISIARELRRWPDDLSMPGPADAPAGQAGPPEPPAPGAAPSAIMQDAQALVRDADRLLGRP